MLYLEKMHLGTLQKKYLIKMTTSAWLLQFQGSLNKSIVWLKKFQNTITLHNSIKLQRAQTLVNKPSYISS